MNAQQANERVRVQVAVTQFRLPQDRREDLPHLRIVERIFDQTGVVLVSLAVMISDLHAASQE